MDSLIWFLHIPKTGGTSTFKILCTGIRHEHIAPWTDQEIEHMVKAGLNINITPYRAMRSHYDYKLSQHIYGKRICKVTILRHPVDRVVSMYNHFRSSHEKCQREAVCGKSLLEFCDMADWNQPGHNLMTRMLAGTYNGHHEDVGQAAAWQNIAGFDAIGTLEHFEMFVNHLSDLFGRRYNPSVAVNQTPRLNYYHATRYERDEVLARNRLDKELWDYAMG